MGKNLTDRFKDKLKKQVSVNKTYDGHTKKLARFFEQAQKKKLSNKKPQYDEITGEEIKRGLADGASETYFDAIQSGRTKIYDKFGISDPLKIKKEHTDWLIREDMAGLSVNHIKKTEQAFNFLNSHAVASGVYKKVKEEDLDIIDHKEMLEYFREEGIVRSSEHSHRYKANDLECEDVIAEMYAFAGGKNAEYADIARFEYLTGGRGIEAIRQQNRYIDLENEKVDFINAKGGLNNTVWAHHWTNEDKKFIKGLIDNADEDGRLFRIKDENGNYRTDYEVKKTVNDMAKRAAKRINLDTGDKEFTAHCFRGGFAYARTTEYTSLSSQQIDEVIRRKIEEQPRLKKRYENFEKHIRDKVQDPDKRVIEDFEKVQWLVSVDLNHSRQDVVRYYIAVAVIKALLAKR